MIALQFIPIHFWGQYLKLLEHVEWCAFPVAYPTVFIHEVLPGYFCIVLWNEIIFKVTG